MEWNIEAEANRYLAEQFRGFFNNLPYLKYGYTFTALYRILQADVPVVLAYEEMAPEEVAFLKQARKNVCVISINEAWRELLENDMTPDFIMGGSLGRGGFDSRLNQAFLIAEAEADNPFLKYHQGKQFFYWTKNPLVKILCEGAQKRAGYLYQYNVMEHVSKIEDIYEEAVYAADYMNASNIIFLGNIGKSPETFKHEKLLCMHGAGGHEFEAVKRLCKIECHVGETVNELYPLLNPEGRAEFDRLVQMWIKEAEDTVLHIQTGIDLYHRLYHMAGQETVYQEDLNRLVAMLNQCMRDVNQNKHVSYVMQIANELDAVLPKQKDIAQDDGNEVVAMAKENAALFEKMRLIFEFFLAKFSDLEELSRDNREYRNELKNHQSVLLVCGLSQYQALPAFTESIKKGLQAQGYHVYLWHAERIASASYNIYQNSIGYDYIIMINGVGIVAAYYNPISHCCQYWYENPNTKAGAIFVDHPRVHADKIGSMGRSVQMFFPDKYWCQYVQNHMPEMRGPYYLPMGGVIQDSATDFEEKENKIVFFGSQLLLDNLSREIQQSAHKELMQNLIEELIARPHCTVEGMMREMGIRYRCPDSMESLMLHEDIIFIVSDYMRNYFREKAVMEIIKSGIPIDVYGWKKEEALQYGNVTFKEKVNFKEMLKICQNARFVLNVNPWLKDGAQERVFNTMLSGSVSVTDTSELLEREFSDGENIVLYRLEEIEKLPATIKYYMDHPAEAKKIAENGYRIAREKHTWEARAREMMELWK